MISRDDIDIFDYISQERYLQIIDDCIQNNQSIFDAEEKLRDKIYANLELAAKKSEDKSKDEKVRTSRTIKFTGSTYDKDVTASLKVAPIITDGISFDKQNSIDTFDKFIGQLLNTNRFSKYITQAGIQVSYNILRDIFFYLVEENEKDNIVTILSFIYNYFDFNILIFIRDYLPVSIKETCRKYMLKNTTIIPDDSSEIQELSLF